MEYTLSQELHSPPLPPRPGAGALLRSVAECPLRPRSAAQRTIYVPLPTAYFVHVVSALGAVVAIIIAVAWGECAPSSGASKIAQATIRVLGNFVDGFAQHPLPMCLAVLGIELGYATLALAVIAWGACDEPVLESGRHALRRAWMQTPQLFLFITMMSAAITYFDQVHAQWDREHPVDYPAMPAMPKRMRPNTPQWDQFNTQMEAYQDEVGRIDRARRTAQPFQLRYGPNLMGVACFFLGWTFLVSLLRAAGTPRHPPRIERPPRCEACGYDLNTIPMESRCPECGEAVVASLGPSARPGPPWKDHADGRVAAWHRTWSDAVFSPTAFGRTLRVTEPATDHRRFLLMHLPFIFAVGACVPPAVFYADEGRSPLPDNAEIVFFVAPVVGLLCVFGAASVTLGTAGKMGFYFHWRDKRNLMPAAIQATCYLIVFLLAWEVFGAATGIAGIVLGQVEGFRAWAKGKRMDPEMIVFFAWFVLNLAWGIVYWSLVRRAVAAARYANK